MKVIIKDLVSGQSMTVVLPAPAPGSSSLVLDIRTEDALTEGTNQSLSARELYVASKGSITVRSH